MNRSDILIFIFQLDAMRQAKSDSEDRYEKVMRELTNAQVMYEILENQLKEDRHQHADESKRTEDLIELQAQLSALRGADDRWRLESEEKVTLALEVCTSMMQI